MRDGLAKAFRGVLDETRVVLILVSFNGFLAAGDLCGYRENHSGGAFLAVGALFPLAAAGAGEILIQWAVGRA